MLQSSNKHIVLVPLLILMSSSPHCLYTATFETLNRLSSLYLKVSVEHFDLNVFCQLFLFFLMFKMPTDAQQSVPSCVSRHFKWMERSQYGGSHRRAMNASQLPLKPCHLSRCIDWAKEGRQEEKFQGFYMSNFMSTRTPCKIFFFIFSELRAWWRLRQQDQITVTFGQDAWREMPSLDPE